MNEFLAQLLADRLSTLPFATATGGARVAGLARLHTGTVNDGDAARTVKLPVPAKWTAAQCLHDNRYLVPDEDTPSIWFFEDGGTSIGTLPKTAIATHTASLRLLGWLNPARLSGPLSENQLLQAVGNALRLRQRHDAGEYRDLLLSATVLPAETNLFGRYTYATETPLLLPPYRLLGLEIKATYVPAPACAPPSTVVASPSAYPAPTVLTTTTGTTTTAADDPDADTVLLTASALIVGGRLVARLGGLLLHYDAANPAHVGALAGVALTTGNAGQLVRVRQDGPATVIGWGLTPDVDYFAGPDGTLVRNAAGLVFSHLIGRAVSPDRLLYAPQNIFIL